MLHRTVMRDVVHTQVGREIRHDQPHANRLAVMETRLAVHLQSEARPA
jgi:hypothetical protein